MRIAFSLPLLLEDRLAPEALRHGHEIVARCSTAHELASRVELLKPDVVIVASTERHLTESLMSVCDGAGVRVLALLAGEADARYATSLGLLETIAADASWPQLEEALARFVYNQPEPVAPDHRGTVVAVWGPAGAPGRTTLAINIAAEIAAAGYSVALGDIDTYSGSIAPALGMLDESPGFAAACRLAGSDMLTQPELERIGQRYSSGQSGFWVLTGIGRPSRWPELSASRVVGTIAQCRQWVDYTILDTGFNLENDEEISSDLFAPRRNAASITALQHADRVIAVGAADPVGMARFLRAHVDLVETVASGRVMVVMNKVRASAVGLNPAAQIAQTLRRFGGIDTVTVIPADQAGLDTAVLLGKTLADAAPKSPARAAIRDFVASRILPPPVVLRRARRRHGLIVRLWSALPGTGARTTSR
ncbi:MAG: tyrosine-protein kinase family protein [Glaciihabitans sp.]|nr:tyrosine-protein kinase family protein [Glaciihabitans sp.]